MSSEEQESEPEARQGYESGAQASWSDEERFNEERDARLSPADYSEVVTVSFTNEHVEQSLDLFLDTITPLSNESDATLQSTASDPDAVVGGMSSQETKDVSKGESEQASVRIEEDDEPHIDELDDVDSVDEWKTYTNSWYGFALELPTAWQVSTQNGETRVSPSLKGKQAIEYVLVKPVPLTQKFSAQDIAQAWVKVLRETWAEVRIVSPHGMGQENEQVIHVEGTLQQARMHGMFVVQINDGLALISGFQVRRECVQRMLPVLQRVLSSFNFIKKVRRKRYIDEDERAYAGYVPIDWAVRACLRRIPTTERTPLVDFQASDPATDGGVAIPPTYEVYSEDAVMERDDIVGYKRVMPATRFIEELLIPRYQARKVRMQVEGVHSCPERSHEINRQQGQGGTIFDVAALQYTCDEAGRTYREQIVLQIMHTPVIATWTVQMVSKRRAPVDYFEQLEPFFAGILEARRTSEAWKRQERARVEERLREAQRNLASASAGYIQAMYALSGSTKSITERLRANIDHNREKDAQEGRDDSMPLLRDAMAATDMGLSYDLPLDFQMYWKHAPQIFL